MCCIGQSAQSSSTSASFDCSSTRMMLGDAMDIAILLLVTAFGVTRPEPIGSEPIASVTPASSYEGRGGGAASRTAAVAAGCAPLAAELRVPSATRALRIRVRIHNDAPIEPGVV